MTKEFSLNINIDIYVVVDYYRPGRPPGNELSDSGDDAEMEFTLYIKDENNKKIELSKEFDFLYAQLFHDILEEFEESILQTPF